jgi:poly(3-hydroxybutyrate) depolymerase
MAHSDKIATRELTGVNVPLFWPMLVAAQMGEQGLELYARNLEFLSEEAKIQHLQRPAPATANRTILDLRTMVLRDYLAPDAKSIPTIVDAPYAGHSAVIADYYKGQSLIETLLANGLDRVFLTDWKSATADMKDLEIDQYLAELNVCVDDLGARVNLIGLCQGGWMSAMYAARFPGKVVSLVLAGAPIDTDAGNGQGNRLS